MREITLSKLSSQNIMYAYGDNVYEITIRIARRVMVMDLLINDEPILDGARILAGVPVIVHEHLMTHGNLAMVTDNDELPNWEKFGDTQNLVFWTHEEYLNER